MNPHPSGLDDPQRARDRVALEDSQEIPQSTNNSFEGCSRADVQHDDSRTPLGLKPRDLAKITIEGDERSPLSRANLEQFLIADAVQMLISNGHHIMTGGPKKFQATASDVLVELELHATGTGMTR